MNPDQLLELFDSDDLVIPVPEALPSPQPEQAPAQSGLQFSGTTGRSKTNNNPLNLEYRPGSYQDKYGAALEPISKSGAQRFAKFPSMEAGYMAGLDQIKIDQERGHTLRTFVAKFAPSHENPTEELVRSYANQLGVDPDTPLAKIPAERMIVPMLARESSTRIVSGEPAANQPSSMMVAGPGAPNDPDEMLRRFDSIDKPGPDEALKQFDLIDKTPEAPAMPANAEKIKQGIKNLPQSNLEYNIKRLGLKGKQLTPEQIQEAANQRELRAMGIPSPEQEALEEPLTDPGGVVAAAVTGGITAPGRFVVPALRTGLATTVGSGMGDLVKDATGSSMAGMATDMALGIGLDKSMQRTANIAGPKIAEYLKGVPKFGELTPEARETATRIPGFNPKLGKVRYQPQFKVKVPGAGYDMGDTALGAPLQDAHIALRDEIRSIRRLGGSGDIKGPSVLGIGTDFVAGEKGGVYRKAPLGTLEPTEFIFNRAETKYPGITDTILTPLRDAKFRVHQEQLIFQEEMDALRKTFENPKDSSLRIGKWLVSEQPEGAKTMQKLGIEVEPLTQQEMDTALKIRTDLKEKWFPEYNKARVLAGQQPIRARENYFTLSRAVTQLQDEGFNPLTISEKVLADKMAGMSEATGVSAKTTWFPWTKRTQSDLPLNFDAFGIYERYGKAAIDFIETSPEVAKLHTFVHGFKPEDSKKGYGNLINETPNLARYIMDTANKAIGVQPPPIVGEFDRGLRKISNNTTIQMLGGAFRTFFVQPFALVTSGAKAGAGNTMWGIADAFDPEKAAFALKHSKVLSTRRFDISKEELLDEIAATGKNTYKDLQNKSLAAMEWMDYKTATAGWWSGFRKALNDGQEFADSVKYADKLIVGSHASPMKLERSAFQSGDMGKALSGLQSFVISEWNFLNQEIFGRNNPGLPTEEAVKRVARYILMATAANSMYQSVGMESPGMQPVQAYRSARERGSDKLSAVMEAGMEPLKMMPFGGGFKYGKPMSVPVAQTLSDLVTGKGPGTVLEAAARLKGVPFTKPIGQLLQTEKGHEFRDFMAGLTGADRLLAPSEKAVPLTAKDILFGRSDEERPAPVSWVKKYLIEDFE